MSWLVTVREKANEINKEFKETPLIEPLPQAQHCNHACAPARLFSGKHLQ